MSAGTLAAVAVLLGSPTASASGSLGPAGREGTAGAYAPVAHALPTTVRAGAGERDGAGDAPAPGTTGVPGASNLSGVTGTDVMAASGGPVPPGVPGGASPTDPAVTPLFDTSTSSSADTPRTSGTSHTSAGGRLGWWPYALAVGLLTGLAVPATRRGHDMRPRRSVRRG